MKQGCAVLGTDNGEADTSLNHAAYWSLSHTNHFIGNRACNSFNGLFFHPCFAPMGRGLSVLSPFPSPLSRLPSPTNTHILLIPSLFPKFWDLLPRLHALLPPLFLLLMIIAGWQSVHFFSPSWTRARKPMPRTRTIWNLFCGL